MGDSVDINALNIEEENEENAENRGIYMDVDYRTNVIQLPSNYMCPMTIENDKQITDDSVFCSSVSTVRTGFSCQFRPCHQKLKKKHSQYNFEHSVDKVSSFVRFVLTKSKLTDDILSEIIENINRDIVTKLNTYKDKNLLKVCKSHNPQRRYPKEYFQTLSEYLTNNYDILETEDNVEELINQIKLKINNSFEDGKLSINNYQNENLIRTLEKILDEDQQVDPMLVNAIKKNTSPAS